MYYMYYTHNNNALQCIYFTFYDYEARPGGINFLRDDPQFEALIMAAPFTTSKLSLPFRSKAMTGVRNDELPLF